MYQFVTRSHHFVISSTMLFMDKPVLFMPLAKRIPGALTKAQRVQALRSQSASTSKKMEQKKIGTTSKKSLKQKTLCTKKEETARIAPMQEKKVIKKDHARKEQPKQVAQKTEVIEQKPQETLEKIKDEAVALEQKINQKQLLPEDSLILGREDLLALQLYEDVQTEVVRVWKPPKGMGGLVCQAKIKIDANGSITQCIIEKPSGVLAYDMSVRIGLLAANMPKQIWGKEIRLTFQ